MAFTNGQLAQQMNNLINYWTTFAQEYADWLGGSVGGGPNSDGEYELTDFLGTTRLVKSPAQLEDDVTGLVSSATTQASAAAASAAAAATSASDADADRIAAEAAQASAQSFRDTASTHATTATGAATTATAQANNASASAAAASTSESNAATSESNAATSETNAAASAAAAAASELATDPDLFGKLADNETVTGLYTFSNASGLLVGAEPVTAALIANWNTAYGWGDHALAGYLTSYTETDPVFTASAAAGIAGSDITNWNTAFGWGDHAGLYEPASAFLTKSSDNETITGNWTFNVDGIGDLVVDRQSAVGASGMAFSNNDGVKGYIGVTDAGNFTFWDSGVVIRMAVDSAGVLTAGPRVLASGTGFVTSPAAAVFGQYNSTTGYVQAPGGTGGKFDIWDQASAAIARFTSSGKATELFGTLEVDGASTLNSSLRLNHGSPTILFDETDAGTDEREWAIHINNDAFGIWARSDVGAYTEVGLRFLRTGTNIDEAEINADLIDINGQVDVSGQLDVAGVTTMTRTLLLKEPSFPGFIIEATNPGFTLVEHDGALNEERWRFIAQSGRLSFQTRLDTDGAADEWLYVTRTAGVIDELGLTAPVVNIDGKLRRDGASNYLFYDSTTYNSGGRITVGTTAPGSPSTGDIWFDTN